jgi:nucleoside-diphosphate-sugar epimerase
MSNRLPVIAILGASGLIGQSIALQLRDGGFPILPIARHFTPAQQAAFEKAGLQSPITQIDVAALARLFDERQVEIIVNCVGVLQDGPGRSTQSVHADFVTRLLEAIKIMAAPALLMHVSIPGGGEDVTAFSRTKRMAEQRITASGLPFVILRPGFVVARAAYGGSALLRSIAALPVDLPKREAEKPFAATNVADISRTVAFVARRWSEGSRDWSANWDIMETEGASVGHVVERLRHHFGGPQAIFRLPGWLMTLGAMAGDLSGLLGWTPPIRSTALAEMRRGISGDPRPWIQATGIEPLSLAASLALLPANVQEKWFARLYLAKGLILVSLALFWIVSGLVALTAAFDAATAILTSHGVPDEIARVATVVSSLTDIAVGIAIAVRRTSRLGLYAGIAVSVLYMIGAAVITPDLWIEPLGALVKTGPAIVLMLVALAISEDR